MKRPATPLEIIVEITGRCRLVCPYCTGPRSPDVPFSDIKSTLDEAAELGIKAIRITGGEPLIHPEIIRILKYTKNKGFHVLLNTAAEDISSKLMKAIISTVDVVLISLQGYNQASNARYTRSKTSYLDKIKNIFLLKAYLPTTWLATVITPQMSQSFDRFEPLVKKINPAVWTLLRPIHESNDDLRTMDIPFYKSLVLKILKARQSGLNVMIANPIPMCLAGNLKTGQEVFFGSNFDDGHVRIVRGAKGFFKPSYFLDENLGQTIEEAWNHTYLKKLDQTDYLPEPCQRCPLLDTCRGGCRAMSQRATGTPFAGDPLFDPSIAQKALETHLPELQPL